MRKTVEQTVRAFFFLKDSTIHDWLISEFRRHGSEIQFLGISNMPRVMKISRIRRIISLHIRYLSLSWVSLRKSQKGDIIICYLDVIGLYVFLLAKAALTSREIIVINLMFNDKNDFITRIKRVLYKSMLRSKHTYPTVTSSQLPSLYRKIFSLPDREFYLLHDCYGALDTSITESDEDENYVFCGGTASRDWDLIRQTAILLPNISFIIVGPKENTLRNPIPPNVTYRHDIQTDEFQNLIRKCSLVALPLNTEAPAGLIVLFTAGLMSKSVVTTDSYTTREYIIPGESGLLVRMYEVKTFARLIDELFRDKSTRVAYGKALRSRVKKFGCPDAFVSSILSITEKVNLA